MSPVIIRHFDTLLGLMRQGALSCDLAHHAMHALENRALWFSQELFDPGDDTEAEADVSTMLEQLADQLHYIVETMLVIRHDDLTRFRDGATTSTSSRSHSI